MDDNSETEYCGCGNCYHRHNGRDGFSYCVFDDDDPILIENIWLRGEDCDAFLSFNEGMSDNNNKIKKEKEMTMIKTVDDIPTMVLGLNIDHQVCIVDDRDGLSAPYNDIIKKIEIEKVNDKVYAIYTTKEYAISFVYDDEHMKFCKYEKNHGIPTLDRADQFMVFLSRAEADAYFNPMSILSRCIQKAKNRSEYLKGRLRILMDTEFFKRYFRREGQGVMPCYEKTFDGIQIIPIDNLECNFIVVKDVSCHWK